MQEQKTKSSVKRQLPSQTDEEDAKISKKSRILTWTLSNGVQLCLANVKSGCGLVGKNGRFKTVVEWMNEPGNIYCGRRLMWVKIYKDSAFCNPFIINKKATDAEAERKRVVHEFKEHCCKQELGRKLWMQISDLKTQHPDLQRVTLGCWCLPLACHMEQLAQALVDFDRLEGEKKKQADS